MKNLKRLAFIIMNKNKTRKKFKKRILELIVNMLLDKKDCKIGLN